MLENAFLNVKLLGVSELLTIRVFSVGNVELNFKNWFTLSIPRPSIDRVYRSMRECWKAKSMDRCNTLLGIRDNKLVTFIKIDRLNLTSKNEQIGNIGRNILINCSIFTEFDPLDQRFSNVLGPGTFLQVRKISKDSPPHCPPGSAYSRKHKVCPFLMIRHNFNVLQIILRTPKLWLARRP